MPNLNQQTPIVVVYKKRKYGKVYLEVFYNTRVDDIIDGNKRKPLINNNYEILEIGVGTGFEERYKKKYKLK
jgi:hypothetical protein